MPPTEMMVSVVIPVDRTPPDLVGLVDALGKGLRPICTHHEIVIVDDRGAASSTSILSSAQTASPVVRVLRLSRRFGREAALCAGLDTVIGDVIVTLDPATDPPAMVPVLVAHVRSGIDVVLGTRRTRGSDAWWLRLGSRLFYRGLARLFGVTLPPNATHFRCLSRQAVNAMLSLRAEGATLLAFTSYIGFNVLTVPYDFVPGARERKTPGEAVKLALDLTLDLSPSPLRPVSWLCLAAALGNVLIGAYELALSPAIAQGQLALATAAASNAVLLLAMAAVCEIIGRPSYRSRSRPMYYVSEEWPPASTLQEPRSNVVDR